MKKTNALSVNKGLSCIVILMTLVISISSTTGTNITVQYQGAIVNGDNLYVGGGGPNNYTSIQDAIDNASDGDTIFVFSGTYYEQKIRVDKSINLIGEDKNTTIVDSKKEIYPFCFTADRIYLTGFQLINSENIYPGIYVESNYNEIVNNIFVTTGESGIKIGDENHHNKIQKNEISECEYGVVLRYDSYENEICQNNIHNCSYGILLAAGDSVISENILTNNCIGMYFSHSSNNKVSQNIVFNSSETGIWVTDNCWGNEICGNLISNSAIEGIYLEYTIENIVKGNSFVNNFLGLYIWNSMENAISSNNFISNKINAFFRGPLNCFNRWIGNYWNEPRTFPKPIFGRRGLIFYFFPAVQFDWNPAKEPYDIEV